MKKNKNGDVIASSTELKNKTGDILALVDEFGEVVLTAYNKPRYKIVKIDVSNFIDLIDAKPTKTLSKKNSDTVAPKKKELVTPTNQTTTLLKEIIDFIPWDREGSKERAFTANATKVMIS